MGKRSRLTLNRPSAGWFSFWAAVLLILPNCSIIVDGGSSAGPNLDPGSSPHSGAVFCDIELERRCATSDDIVMGTRLASAAEALVAGQADISNIALDDSPAKLADCSGVPEAIVFHDVFPRGTSACVNCGDTIPGTYANANEVCQARCHDLEMFGTMTSDGMFKPTNPPTADTIAFCTANARVSTNFPLNGCFEDTCTTAGMLENFEDPRRIPEEVGWVQENGVIADGGTLTRNKPTTGFSDAGASSSQRIARDDAFLEFIATETNTARTVALSSGPPPAGGITFTDMDFGLLLMDTGEIIALENGLQVGSFGLYAAESKFRLKLRDNFDGTATVSYVRITGSCVHGSPCNETVFYTSPNTIRYPVRVDAMFREQGGTVTEARIARIRRPS
jgi:hypothetical protein